MRPGLSWLPILTSLVFLFTLLITYGIGAGQGHIRYVLPYISDSGISYPESSLFSFLFDIVAIMMFCNVCANSFVHGAYFKQMRASNESRSLRSLQNVNKACVILGGVASLGIALVANFPYDDGFVIHIFGALLCFTLAVIYCYLQSWVAYRLSPNIVPRWTPVCRLLLSVLATTAYVTFILFGFVIESESYDHNRRNVMISAACEWILVVSLILFFLTYTPEFCLVDLSLGLLYWDQEHREWNPEVTQEMGRRLNEVSESSGIRSCGHMSCFRLFEGRTGKGEA